MAIFEPVHDEHEDELGEGTIALLYIMMGVSYLIHLTLKWWKVIALLLAVFVLLSLRP